VKFGRAGEAKGSAEPLARLVAAGVVAVRLVAVRLVAAGLVLTEPVAVGLVLAEPVAVGLVLAEPVAVGLVLAEPVAAEVAADGRAGAVDCGGTEWAVEADVPGRAVCPLPGAVAGLNVATDSIAPATRHTARMLASSGMMVPCPAKGPASRRNRFLRLCARISRW
jgi:hypothetical protein